MEPGGVRWDLRYSLCHLSSHATDLTPGPLQVLLPFSSLQALAFSFDVKDRRVPPTIRGLSLDQTLPAIAPWRYLTGLHHSLYVMACDFGWRP